jgi:hypothetical protein
MTPSKNDQQIAIQIAALLSKLEDPFQMFPIEQVANTLAESVADSEEHGPCDHGYSGRSS